MGTAATATSKSSSEIRLGFVDGVLGEVPGAFRRLSEEVQNISTPAVSNLGTEWNRSKTNFLV